jgi:hypothetical protein
MFVRKREGKLVPADHVSVAAIDKLSSTGILFVEVKLPRNLLWHRKMFALFNLLYENQSRFPTMDDLRAALLVYIGFCTEVTLKDGRTAFIPKSLSFAKLDQVGFEQLWSALVAAACEHIIPNMKDEDLRREIEELVAG